MRVDGSVRARIAAALAALGLVLPAAALAVASDDFNACAVDGSRWSFVDPQGDSSYSIVGAGSGNARLQISVPAGLEHDPWKTNHAARLMQTIGNVDFDVAAKFDSPVTQKYQSQGLMVEAGAGNWVRFDVYSDGSATQLFLASIASGKGKIRATEAISSAVPVYLRLRRQGDTWTAFRSSDGQAWQVFGSFSHAANVASVGVFAGNDTPSPAHTAEIDWFFDVAAPIANEDQGSVTSSNQLVVDVQGNGAVTANPDQSSYSCGQSVTLSAQPGSSWSFAGWSGDASGTANPLTLVMSADRNVTATFQVISTPPTISAIQVSPGQTGATVTWTTDQPATSQVVYGRTTGYELGTVADGALVTSHSATLAGLSPGTTYHAQITSRNELNQATSSGDLVFSTDAAPAGPAAVSDDFNGCTLDTALWTFVDPHGDSSASLIGAGSGDAKLRISVPAGQEHDPWVTNNAARLMQTIGNVDFDVAAKFDSPVTQKYQSQGLMVEAGAGNWVRFDVYSDGTNTKLFLGSVQGGTGTVRSQETIAASFPIYLRLRRIGNTWSAFRSSDGSSWQAAGSFSHTATVSSVGVFAGNDTPSPAHTAEIDWFFDLAAPITDEDQGAVAADNDLVVNVTGNGTVAVSPSQAHYSCGQSVTLTAQPAASWSFTGWSGDLSGTQNPASLLMSSDRTVTATFSIASGPPAISGVQATNVTTSSATIQWTTDQPATSAVDYGRTTSYELGTIQDSALVTQHALTLSGLAAGALHHYRARSVNSQGSSSSSGDGTFTTQSAGGPGGPVIDVWYGDTQRFGDIGVPQPHVNILGNASDPQGVSSLSYRLNGGPSVALSLGPDGRRLADPGDFNADISIDDLDEGSNTVTITAVDGNGNSTVKSVTAIFHSSNVWPQTYSIDWSQVGDVTDVAQVVDGLWEVEGSTLRPVQVDYDRLVAIGDMDWGDYRVVVPITIHGYSPDGFDQYSSKPGVGLLLRWQRHTPPGQPERGFELGAIGFYRIGKTGKNRLEMWTADSPTTPGKRRDLAYEVPYVFKMEVQRMASAHQYRFKVWEQGTPEPSDWDLVEDQPLTEAARGALLLVAHHMDVSFGDVAITPIP